MEQVNSNWANPISVTTFSEPGEIVAALEEVIYRASGTTSDDYFGCSIAFSEDKSILVVGAQGASSSCGAAYIYKYENKRYVLKATLTSSTAAEVFGMQVACSSDGTRIVIAGPSYATNTGRVHIYDWNGTTWTSKQILTHVYGQQVKAGGLYGKAIAISADGNVVVVGLPGASGKGRIQIYRYNGSSFVMELDLLAPTTTSGCEEFGRTVSLSKDGIVLAVGSGRGSPGVYIYQYNGSSWDMRDNIPYTFTGIKSILHLSSNGERLLVSPHTSGEQFSTPVFHIYNYNGTSWDLEATFTKISGNTVATYGYWSGEISGDGDTVAIGYPEDDDPGTNTGSVLIYRRNSQGTWEFIRKIGNIYRGVTNNGDAPMSSHGYSVALSNDGNDVFIGSVDDGDSTKSGMVYVHKLIKSSFLSEEVAIISDPTYAMNSLFGTDLAISLDGQVLAVGAYGSASYTGALTIFTRSGETWTKIQKTVPSDAVGNDYFGASVAISSDGSTIAVGAYGEDDSGSNAGAIYVYIKSGASWVLQSKIVTSAVANGVMGYIGHLSISNDGNRIVTVSRNTGHLHIFKRTGVTWALEAKVTTITAYAVSISGDGLTIVFGDYAYSTPGTNSGRIGILTWNGVDWTTNTLYLQEPLIASYDEFGQNLAISNDGLTIAVCSKGDSYYANNCGTGHIFRKINGTWTHIARLLPYGNRYNSGFYSVAISGNGKLVAFGLEVNTSRFVFVYKEIDGVYRLVSNLRSSDWVSGDAFGNYGISFSEDGSRLVVGAPNKTSSTGKAYIFK